MFSVALIIFRKVKVVLSEPYTHGPHEARGSRSPLDVFISPRALIEEHLFMWGRKKIEYFRRFACYEIYEHMPNSMQHPSDYGEPEISPPRYALITISTEKHILFPNMHKAQRVGGIQRVGLAVWALEAAGASLY